MRASRRLALFSANENYEYFDFIHLTVRSNIRSNSAFPRLITPVSNTDVLIQSSMMLDGKTSGEEQQMILSKSGGNNDLYGAAIRSSKWGGVPVLGWSSGIDIETGGYWINSFDRVHTFEARFSLNNLGSNNYLNLSNHQINVSISGTQTDEHAEHWCLFGATDGVMHYASNLAGVTANAYIGETKFFNYAGTTLLADLVPCIQMPLKRIGMFDKVSNTFCPAEFSDGRDIGTYFELVNAE